MNCLFLLQLFYRTKTLLTIFKLLEKFVVIKELRLWNISSYAFLPSFKLNCFTSYHKWNPFFYIWLPSELAHIPLTTFCNEQKAFSTISEWIDCFSILLQSLCNDPMLCLIALNIFVISFCGPSIFFKLGGFWTIVAIESDTISSAGFSLSFNFFSLRFVWMMYSRVLKAFCISEPASTIVLLASLIFFVFLGLEGFVIGAWYNSSTLK